MANHKSGLWGIFVVSIALISLCALSTPANAGVSPDVGRDINLGDSAIIGETNLRFFFNETTAITEGVILSNWENSHIVIPFSGSFDSSRYEDELLPGEYKIRGVDEGNVSIESYIYFVSPKLDVSTEVNGEEFEWVTRGGEISFNADTNLWIIAGSEPNYITYKLLDPDMYDKSSISNIDVRVDGVNTTTINTTDMKTGTYTLSIETDLDTNNGLDAEGPEISFEVRSKGVTIEANEEKQVVTEDIVFTVSTTPHTNITVYVTWGRESQVTFDAGGTFDSGESDEDGKFITSASFADTGSYEITATEETMDTTDSIPVEIVPYEAEVKVDKDPPFYHIGENIKITGSATAGDSITLKIEDEVVATGLDVAGFDYTWNTEDKAPGSYKIAIWVKGVGSPFSDPETDPPDDSLTIMLLRGGLFVETSVDFVALGDTFIIEGIVPGRDRVDILTISPDGGGGRGFDPDDIWEETNHNLSASGITYATSGVTTDGTFKTEEKEFDVGEDVDTGTYWIAALNYGRDGRWGRSYNNNLLEVISNDYATALGAKTTDQLLAILKEKTINAAGTDDLLGIATIKVEKGFVTLDETEDVPLGEDIQISGTTNRQVDTPIIVTVEGLGENAIKLKPEITKVKVDDKIFYNTFSISFDTASANIGKYEVTADDGDGHTATTTVNILPVVELSVNVSATPPPTPEAEGQEPEPEEEAEEPTPEPEAATPTPEEEAGPSFLTGTNIVLLIWIIVTIVLAVWVYRDAIALGQNGVVWLIATLVFGIFGLIIWLSLKQKLKKRIERL